MKNYYILLMLFIINLWSACEVEDAKLLPGIWKMERVESKTGKLIASKPKDEKGNVMLEFPDAELSTFSGNTPSNRFSATWQSVEGQQVKVESFGTTKAGERFWGDQFQKRIRYVNAYKIIRDKLYLQLNEEQLVFIKIH